MLDAHVGHNTQETVGNRADLPLPLGPCRQATKDKPRAEPSARKDGWVLGETHPRESADKIPPGLSGLSFHGSGKKC